MHSPKEPALLHLSRAPDATAKPSLPLEGICVVSLEQAIAGPLATRHLADLGARVIKVERPGAGDFARAYDATVNGMASHFVWVNRSKESLTLNLKRPEAREILRSLLAKCDVFVHNLAPGAVERFGFPTSAVRETNPRLIVCQISGYGSTGPLRHKKAYDLLIQAESGLLSITGTETTPVKVGISVADIAAGTYAFSGILAALLARERTGQGAAMEVSMLEALAEWMGYPLYYAGYSEKTLRRAGAHHAAIAPYGPFTAGDGAVIYFGVQNEREWRRFCEHVLEQPALIDDARFRSNSRRVEHRKELEALIGEQFSQLRRDELIRRLDKAEIANAPMNTVAELLEHAQLAARRRWRDVDSPVGPVRALLPPLTMEDIEPRMAAIPEVGQHTRKILSELGIDQGQIESWRAQGIV